ncbi:MAG: FKBP-type peptidyl-prolyl cis-trans isomerase [Cytophagales bacterium]|nr:FKBP-type peptidyl-prolyl cis-trans isomerase [Cytophagales bacterium]MDW8384009.1 FKBP-type peptidyl-prolyl cis-trans isomerase [Flammeovirgaceae bacterium]
MSAQCDKKCQKVPEKVDYCFQDTLLFPGQCAQFIQGQNYFYLNGKKAPFKISFLFPVDTKYLLSLANNKQLKLSTADVLFIQQALQVWKVEEKKLGYTEYESGLGIKILKEGDGALPVPGKIVVVHYTGTLEDGTKFDSSIERGEPFRFPLGQGYVIRGWDEGIAKLKVGTKAMLRIPPHIGYGNRPVGPIPANSTLYFEVELLQIED